MSNEHLQVTESSRGFASLPAIPSEYGGAVSVSESSAASGPHVWLRVTAPVDLNRPDGATVEAPMQLTAENATKLGEQLLHVVANHYQNEESEPQPVVDREAVRRVIESFGTITSDRFEDALLDLLNGTAK